MPPIALFKVQRLRASEVPDGAAQPIWTMADKSTRNDEGYPADKARGGEIVLRRRWQKIVFFGALVAAVMFGLFVSLWGR